MYIIYIMFSAVWGFEPLNKQVLGYTKCKTNEDVLNRK